MKRVWHIFIIYIIGISIIGSAAGTSFYTWSGSINVGESIYVNNIALTVDKDNRTNELALVISGEDVHGLLEDGQKSVFAGLEITFNAMNDYGVVSISSDQPFTISLAKSEDYTEKIKQLEEENAALKAQNANLSQKIGELEAQVQELKAKNEKLKNQASSTTDVQQLNAKITQLEKENRELKAQLANLTNKYNAVAAKAKFLEQQNDEYRQIIQQVMKSESEQSKQDYIEKAEKEKLVGSVLLKSIIFAAAVVGLIGYGLYRVKRRHEFVGL